MSFTSSLVRRDLSVAVAARSVSLLGDQAAVVALALRQTDRGAPPWTVAALLIAGLVPLVVLAPLAGRLIDRLDSRRLLVVAGLAQAALCLGLATAATLPVTLALVAALGAFEAITGSTWQALLPAIVGVDNLPRALGLAQSGSTVAFIAAPVTAGVLAGRFGTAVPLLLDAGSYLLVVVGALVVRTRRAPRRAVEDTRGGLAMLRADSVLGVLILLLGVMVVLGAMVNVVEVFLIRDTLHSSSTWFGLVGGLWGVGLLAGSLLGSRIRGQLTLVRWLLAAVVVLSVAVAGYAGAPAVGWLVPMALLGGTANGVVNLTLGALVMQRAPEQARGRIAATMTGVTSGASVGAYLLGGVLALALTPREIYALSGTLALLAPALFARRLLHAAAPTSRGAVATVTEPRRAIAA